MDDMDVVIAIVETINIIQMTMRRAFLEKAEEKVFSAHCHHLDVC